MFRYTVFLVLCCSFCSFPSFAQFNLSGQVVNPQGEPLAGASVFINNSSLGTVSGNDGRFTLYIPTPVGEVVFSMVGYSPENIRAHADMAALPVKIILQPYMENLDDVVVRAPLKDGWALWGQFFLESFLGRTAEARDCKIQNTKAIRIYFDKETNVMTARATEPLRIRNAAMGYEIEYRLEEFLYDNKNKITYFSGYPFFKPMKGGRAKQRKWERNRFQSYEGSMMHFMRALFINQTEQEGFRIQPAVKKVNEEKARVRSRQRQLILSGSRNDSSAYYSRIMAQPDSLFLIGSPMPAEQIRYNAGNNIVGLDFDNHLLITYTRKNGSADIQALLEGDATLSSFIRLLYDESILLFRDGSFIPGSNILTERYWAHSEKIARMLPFDYRPPEK